MRLPSPGTLIACVALFAALGGGAYALGRHDASRSLDLHRVKANPLNASDPCESGKTGVFCGVDSVSGLRGWRNLGSGYEPVTYARDGGDVVHLQGTMALFSSGTGLSFILPKAYRPAGTLEFPAAYGQDDTCGGAGCDERLTVLRVLKNGRVFPVGAAGIGVNFREGVSLDGITFSAR